MRALSIVLLLMCVPVLAHAQGAARVADELARGDFASSAKIEVRLAAEAQTALAAADRNPYRGSIAVFGVRLLSDNSQSARENAAAVAARFSEIYPDIPVAVTYESPYFLATAGRFVDRADAIALSGRVANQFRTAMVVQREASPDEIVDTLRAAASAVSEASTGTLGTLGSAGASGVFGASDDAGNSGSSHGNESF